MGKTSEVRAAAALRTRTISIVIVAEYHNPSILNHDFLIRNAIIDASWGGVSDFVSMPPYSTLTYKSRNIQISCQEPRLQFTKQLSADAESFSDLISCASDYIRVLEHVNYKNFGLNVGYILECDNGPEWARDRFLQTKFHAPPLFPNNMRITLRYERPESATINIEIRPQSGQNVGQVRIHSNYNSMIHGDYNDFISKIKQADLLKSQNDQLVQQIVGGSDA